MRKVIFDLDDTLYQSKELRTQREEALLKFLGERKSEYLELRKHNSTLKSLEKLGISREKFYEEMEKVPITLEKDENLRKSLEKLKENRRLVVISNISTKCVRETLERLGVLDLVDEYYGGDKFKQSKPAEENFSIVDAGDLCIGNDFRKDLEIPKKKGATTVLVSESFNPAADFTIKNIHELNSMMDRFL